VSTSTPSPIVTRPAPRSSTVRPRRKRARRVLAWIAAASCLAGAALWAGLRVEPAHLPAPALAEGATDVTALPADLPPPVERFYRTLYGEQIPVIETIVISGRGTMRIQGVTFPSRYRFSHRTGVDYRHYIETTVFGAPLLKVDEWYVDGAGRLELPFGVSEGPKVDQGANLALWAELVWAPAVWVTSPSARWEPVDAITARLIVPFGESTEQFTVTFDPATGLLRRMESLRYKGADATEKTLWVNDVREWGELDGRPVPIVTAVRWGDESSPWAVLRTEEVLVNADLSTYLRAGGQ
jgi:hypothetical protein